MKTQIRSFEAIGILFMVLGVSGVDFWSSIDGLRDLIPPIISGIGCFLYTFAEKIK